jgi:hypothetical protein
VFKTKHFTNDNAPLDEQINDFLETVRKLPHFELIDIKYHGLVQDGLRVHSALVITSYSEVSK